MSKDPLEKEKSTELGAKLSRGKIQLLKVSHGSDGRPDAGKTFLIKASGQTGEAFLFEEGGDAYRTELLAFR